MIPRSELSEYLLPKPAVCEISLSLMISYSGNLEKTDKNTERENKAFAIPMTFLRLNESRHIKLKVFSPINI